MSQTDWRPSEIQLDRIAYRRQRTVRSATISAVSTLVLGTIVIVAVTRSPGWPRVKETYFDVSYGWQVLPGIAKGLWLNIRIMVVCEIFILIFAMMLAVARTLRGPVFFPIRAAATVYVDLFRGLPQLVVLLGCGFGIPALQLQGLPTSTTFWGAVALILTYSAYVAEVLRAGHGVGPSEPARGRPLARALARAVVALRRDPARRTPRHPGPAQRPRVAAEGHQPGLDPRRRRGDPDGADRHRQDVQLHAVRGRRRCCSCC